MALHVVMSTSLAGLTSLQNATSSRHGDQRYFAVAERDLEMAAVAVPRDDTVALDLRRVSK
jgi:hypothetical protein